MLLEIIATSLEDAERAEAGGANRIELVADLKQGGLTPDMALVKRITDSVQIPVHVMIRPHARSFHMSNDDVTTMIHDIQRAEHAGAAALVWGVLTQEQTIDLATVELLLAASDLPVTFHRAFDEIKQQDDAVRVLLTFKKIRSVLTSGGAPSVLEAVEQLRELELQTKGQHLNILAGGGLTLESLEDFVLATSVRSVHMGTAVRVNRRVDEPVDVRKVSEARLMLDRLGRLLDETGGNQ